jgi:tRNA(Arg) A34 adenosine deaminase TadA
MCAHAIGLMGIREVYFGAYNNKFGGNGSIMNI